MVFFYTIFFFSGIIKVFLLHYNIPTYIDFTATSIILLIIFSFFKVVKCNFKTVLSKNYFISISSLLIFYFWILITKKYSTSDSYSFTKAVFFVTNIIAFVFPLLFKDFDIKLFIKYLVLFTFSFNMIFFTIYDPTILSNQGITEISGLYLSLGIINGVLIVVLSTSRKTFFYNKYIDHLISLVFFAFTMFSGARGPILFAIFCVFLYISIQFILNKIKYNKKILISLPIVLLIAVPLFLVVYNSKKQAIEPLLERSIYRLALLFDSSTNNQDNQSVTSRVEMMDFAINKITESPQNFLLGTGIGSFGYEYTGHDVRAYPHNIFIEILFELGLVGLLLFLFFLTSIFVNFKSNQYITFYVLLYILLNISKSSSLVDLRTFFTFFALYIINYQNNNYESMSSNVSPSKI